MARTGGLWGVGKERTEGVKEWRIEKDSDKWGERWF